MSKQYRVVGPSSDIHVEEYDTEEYESAQGFNQGFYLGSKDQARLHKWYVLLGLIAGGVLGWLL